MSSNIFIPMAYTHQMNEPLFPSGQVMTCNGVIIQEKYKDKLFMNILWDKIWYKNIIKKFVENEI